MHIYQKKGHPNMVFKVALAFMTLTNIFILQIVPSRVFQNVNFSSSSRDYGVNCIHREIASSKLQNAITLIHGTNF